MARTILAQLDGAGQASSPSPRVGSFLAAEVDQLFQLRGLIRQAEAEERRLTQEVVSALRANRVGSLRGSHAVAILAERTTLRVDPEFLHLALGRVAFSAMTVNVTAARQHLGEAELRAISEPATTAVLRTEAIERGTSR